MRGRFDCEKNVISYHSLLDRNGIIRHILPFFISLLSIFMLFNTSPYELDGKIIKKETLGRKDVTKSLLYPKNHNNGFIFNVDYNIEEVKIENNKFISIYLFSGMVAFLFTYIGHVKSGCLKTRIVSSLLAVIVYYMYQSDGKKREFSMSM